MARSRRRFTKEFKAEVVNLIMNEGSAINGDPVTMTLNLDRRLAVRGGKASGRDVRAQSAGTRGKKDKFRKA